MLQPEKIKKLSDLEFSIYEYILQHTEKVNYMSIRQLAEATNVSTATISRFCKTCGFRGFSEFKFQINNFLEERTTHRFIGDKFAIQDNLNKILANEEYDKKIEQLCQIIHDKKDILFIGGGLSGIVGRYGARYLSSVGKFALYVDDLLYPYHEFNDDSLVIVLSTSGETHEIIYGLNKFKGKQCYIASFTNNANSTIANSRILICLIMLFLSK